MHQVNASLFRSDERLTLETSPFQIFTVLIQPLSTRLIKPNFCFTLPPRSTTVSLETRNFKRLYELVDSGQTNSSKTATIVSNKMLKLSVSTFNVLSPLNEISIVDRAAFIRKFSAGRILKVSFGRSGIANPYENATTPTITLFSEAKIGVG